MYKYREPELEQYKSIWLTKECHNLLRKEKDKTGEQRSMAKILNDLILKHYGNENK